MFSPTLNLPIMRLCDLSIALFDRKSLHLCFPASSFTICNKVLVSPLTAASSASFVFSSMYLFLSARHLFLTSLSFSQYSLVFFLLTIPTYSPLVHFGFKKFPFIYCFPRYHRYPPSFLLPLLKPKICSSVSTIIFIQLCHFVSN